MPITNVIKVHALQIESKQCFLHHTLAKDSLNKIHSGNTKGIDEVRYFNKKTTGVSLQRRGKEISRCIYDILQYKPQMLRMKRG